MGREPLFKELSSLAIDLGYNNYLPSEIQQEQSITGGENGIAQHLQLFYAKFSKIPVTVFNPVALKTERITVRPPYYMLAGNPRRREKAEINRKQADSKTQKILSQLPRRARTDGKSTPEDIKSVLEKAGDEGLLISTSLGITSDDLRNWLVKYGIGIDCSGFVSQAIVSVLSYILQRPPVNEESLSITGTHSSALSSISNKKFIAVSSPEHLAAGDTMHIDGHIRIIQRVRRFQDYIEITTIESTSTKNDIGPYQRTWKFTRLDNFKTLKLKTDIGAWREPGPKDIKAQYSRYKLIDAYLKANQNTPNSTSSGFWPQVVDSVLKGAQSGYLITRSNPPVQTSSAAASPSKRGLTTTPVNTTRGGKNHNPGNIKMGRDKWVGSTGDDGTFVKFSAFEYGLRAMIKLIRNYIKNKKLQTVRDIISTYAPASENPTEAYIRLVSNNNPDWKPNPDNKSDMYQLISKMVKQEIGYVLLQSQFDTAWSML